MMMMTCCCFGHEHKEDSTPTVYLADGDFRRTLLDHCPLLSTVYRPPWWCRGSMLQTLVGNLRSMPGPLLPYSREYVRLSDGGQLALDWIGRQAQPDNVVIIVPGITGCTFENYIQRAVRILLRLDVTVVVYNNRGLGDVPLLTPKAFCLAETEDLDLAIGQVGQRTPGARRLLMGFSTGGGMVIKYLARKCGQDPGVHAGMCISPPWDPEATVASLERCLNHLVFDRYVVKRMCAYIKGHERVLSKAIDLSPVYGSASMRDLDQRFTAPLNGYASLAEYYEDLRLGDMVGKIDVPLLCLNAADDTFSPLGAIPLEPCQRSPNVAVVLTKRGGHMGFLRADFPRVDTLSNELLEQYTSAMFGHYL